MSNILTYGSLGLSLLGTVAGVTDSRAAKKEAPKKPNLLFIWTDQQVDKTIAVYGNRVFQVPNMNALADESVVFANTRVVQPVSTPSRGSVMTGLYPHQHGASKNNCHLNKDAKTLPELIDDAQYATGYFGKWHLGDEIFAQHGFQEFGSVEDKYFDVYSEGRDRSARSGYFKFLIDNGLKPNDKENNLFSRSFIGKLPYEYGKPKYLETAAVDFMNRHKDEPFILYVNYLEPHNPFEGPFNELHDKEALGVSPSMDVPFDDDTPMRYRIKQLNDWTLDDFKEAKQHYAGLCNAVDRSLGNILRCLDSLGLRDNTIVVFTSDHGEMMGAHRLMHKSVMYEEALRVPCMMRIPWLNGNEQRIVSQNITNVDLVPTILELMGAGKRDFLPGRSLVPLMKGKKRPGDDGYTVMIWNQGNIEKENYKPGPEFTKSQIIYYDSASYRTVVAPDGWKMTVSDRDKYQLFNLNDDPYECYNLYYKGTQNDRIKKLSKKLREWQARVNDTMAWKEEE